MRHFAFGFLKAGRPWVPTDLATDLYAWFTADDLSSTPVASWTARGGSSLVASQGTAGNRPAWSATGLNSKPAVTPDGTNDTLTWSGPAYSGASGFCCFALANVPATATLTMSSGATGAPNFDISSGNIRVVRSNQALILSGGSVSAGIRVLAWEGASSYAGTWIDGTGTTNTTDPAFGAAATTFWNDAGAQFWNTAVRHMVFTKKLATLDRQRLEGYLAWDGGVQANLPGGHPYLTSPP